MRSLQSVQTPLDAVSTSRYRLLVELGHGGMANVCLAVQLGSAGFRRLAVLKRLRPQLSEDADFLEMFLQEARLAARLNHPNVVHTHEVGRDEECHFMALEYLQGQSYGAVLARAGREQYDFGHSVRVLIEALKGLEYAHQLKDFDGTPLHVVHRDISPSNIFITYDGQIKILDFGIAKAMRSSVETKVGTLKGKVSYMSPEQASGEGVTQQTDLYAVGVLLWEAAAGKRRWRGVPELTVLRKLLARDEPQSPDSLARDLPRLVDSVCMRALAPNPQQRFADAVEFREALELILEVMGRRVSAEEVGRAVAVRFEEDRQKLQHSVNQELAKLQRDEDLTLSSLVRPTRPGSAPPSGQRLASTPGVSADQARTETEIQFRAQRSWLPLLLGGIALVLGIGAFVLSRRSESPPLAVPSASAGALAAPSAAASAQPSATSTAAEPAADNSALAAPLAHARPNAPREPMAATTPAESASATATSTPAADSAPKKRAKSSVVLDTDNPWQK